MANRSSLTSGPAGVPTAVANSPISCRNSLPVTIRNAFLDYLTLDLGPFLSPGEEEEAFDPIADFDGDGVPNIGEFLLGTSAALPGDVVPVRPVATGGQVAKVRWSLRADREEIAASTVQMSEDLKTWTELRSDSETKVGAIIHREAGISHEIKTLYLRLFFEVPGGS